MNPMQYAKEREAFAAESRLIEDLGDAVRGVKAAGDDCAALGKVYKQLVGYDLHDDDPSLDAVGLRDFILDYVREACGENDIPTALVGVDPEGGA